MTENKKVIIFDINEIFKDKNYEEKTEEEFENQQSNEDNKEIDIGSIVINENKSIPEEEKKEKKKAKIATIVFFIFFVIEMGFTAFMLYNLYYIFNRPSREIDISGKYNNTLNFQSMSSNLGTINGTSLEMFHNVNISAKTRFINFSKIALFYPNGTICNNSFRVDTLYTENLVFTDTNILGRGNFRDSLNFNSISMTPLKDFSVVEIRVGKYKVTSDKVEDTEGKKEIDLNTECDKPFGSKLLEVGDSNTGEVIGQYNRKLVILKDTKIFLRANNNDDLKIFEFEDKMFDNIEFVNFVTRNDEMGVILKNQTGYIKIFDSQKELNLPNNIVTASLFKNKTLIYCTDECYEIKIMHNIDKPENNSTLLSNPRKSKFLAGRLYGGKIIIASSEIINNNNQNIFVHIFKNPIDISTFGKAAVITDHDSKENIFNFWLFKNNQTKLIKSVHANAAKASFIHLNHIIIAYSAYGYGTFYINYDIFNDQLSPETSVSENCFDSFYISHELLSLFGNTKKSDFSFLQKFSI